MINYASPVGIASIGECAFCNRSFHATNYQQKYCSAKCRNDYHRKKYFKDHPSKPFVQKLYKNPREEHKKITGGLASPTTGAISELFVSCDLLKRGYYVFRSMTPNSPYDIIATKNGDILKIEVRTGTLSKYGKVPVNKATNHPNDLADHWAVYVRETSSIYYDPPLKIEDTN